jgi:hypothetical protein
MDVYLWRNCAFDEGITNTLPWIGRLRGLEMKGFWNGLM